MENGAVSGRVFGLQTKNLLSKKHQMNLYLWTVSVVGGLISLYALFKLPDDIWGVIIFILLAVAAELGSVELFQTSRNSRVSVSAIVGIAAMLLFGPWIGALVAAASGAATIIYNLRIQKQTGAERASLGSRLAFNTGMMAISGFCGGWVYIKLGGTVGNVFLYSNFLPLLMAVSTDSLINSAILTGILSIQTGQKSVDIWTQNFKWALPIIVVGGIVGGGILVYAYEKIGIWGLLVFFLPIFSISYSFRVYANSTRIYVNKLEEMNNQLDKANLNLLGALGTVIDTYDVFTAGHSHQVAIYAGALATEMGLAPEEQSEVVRAALVHDIGKIGIGETILSKPGSLTEAEFEEVMRHPAIGADILQQMDGLQSLAPFVRHHHERWDGGGYPDHLAGNDILLGARIIALADALDAMLSDRPYRKPRTLDDAYQAVIQSAGSQFDPQVVEAFNRLYNKKPRIFFKNSAEEVNGHHTNQKARFFHKAGWIPSNEL